MMAEVEVARIVERHKVNMRVRHINADNSDTHLDAGANLLEAFSNPAAETMKIDEEIVIKVEDVVLLFLGDTEYMTLDHGINIEESEKIIGLGNLVAWYLACNYS